MSIRAFVDEHYRHFNAGALASTARSLTAFLQQGGRVFITLAGAMSTAELGRSLAPMIRAGHVAGISCTGANLEEDVFNLVAHDSYERIEDWRSLSAADDAALLERGLTGSPTHASPRSKRFVELKATCSRLGKQRLKPANLMPRISTSTACFDQVHWNLNSRQTPKHLGS